MKKLLLSALLLAFASAAIAATRVQIKPNEVQQAAGEAAYKKYFDHPKTEAMSNSRLKIAITTDLIERSCCRPPDLVVAGKVTNRSTRSINYVHFVFAFENEDGKVLHAETVYNHKAESMADDEEIQRILKEKPHFTPLQPGDTDTFAMSVPLPILPRFAKVEMYSSDIQP